MELHHGKHHQTYVNNLNTALKSYANASSNNDITQQIALQSAIRFNGGGHINHSLFWENLAPATSPNANPDSAPKLVGAIKNTWGSLDAFKGHFNKALLGLQGSGWGWLVKDAQGLRIITTKDQDPVVGGEVPIFGVDMWEHAYYLQVSSSISLCHRASAKHGAVPQRQGRLRGEYLERHQLEDSRDSLQWWCSRCLQNPQGLDLKSWMPSNA